MIPGIGMRREHNKGRFAAMKHCDIPETFGVNFQKTREFQTPVFPAFNLEKKWDMAAKALHPIQTTAATPFRPKAQRFDRHHQIGLFGQASLSNNDNLRIQPKKFAEVLPSSPDLNESKENNKQLQISGGGEVDAPQSPERPEESFPQLLSVLATPVISRKTPLKSRLPAAQLQDNVRCHTPQSILKVKKMLNNDELTSSPALSTMDLTREVSFSTTSICSKYIFTKYFLGFSLGRRQRLANEAFEFTQSGVHTGQVSEIQRAQAASASRARGPRRIEQRPIFRS